MKNHSKNIKIIKHREGQSKSTDDFVAIEEPLEIRIENKSIAIVMRTPGHDQELTAGFLLSEGAIKSLYLIHISDPTTQLEISYYVYWL